MEAVLLALLASYGLPALFVGVASLGLWQLVTKFYIPEQAKKAERDERYIKTVEQNTSAFHGLQGAVDELRGGIADLRDEIRENRKDTERLSADVDVVKGDIKELKGYLNGSRHGK